ncbi:MAG: UvrD-helicase domain-containing protein [Candidatus Methanomethylophilaceae archaeon]|nr:UvrD-helicase domain-containing protein [Candidatus Methanomethylophilaceae archaeon]
MNDGQRRIVEHRSSSVVVDAGPGTGKTTTVVSRYLSIVDSGVDPQDIMMITFTNNAAGEMRNRIRGEFMKRIEKLYETVDAEERKGDDKDYVACANANAAISCMKKQMDRVRTSTFDSLCLRIVLDAPECVSDFFGFKDVTLTRNARMEVSESLNLAHFDRFYSSFLDSYGHLYVKRSEGHVENDIPLLLADKGGDVFGLINQLMCAGIIPLADEEWFSDGLEQLRGNRIGMEALLRKNGGAVATEVKKLREFEEDPKYHGDKTLIHEGDVLTDSFISDVVEEDRELMIYFINKVYYEYIRRSVADNRLTYALTALFAFCVLYTDERSRENNSVEHLIVDEFQDTNEMQMKISLMLSKGNNLCAVGDWKQGIYGFRFANVDNIIKFKDRMHIFSKELNRGGIRRTAVDVDSAIERFCLEENYRSHEIILKWAFEALNAPGKADEVIHYDEPPILLDAKNTSKYGDHSGFGIYVAKDKDDEAEAILNKVTEFVNGGGYLIHDGDDVRKPEYGDIAILYPSNKGCMMIYDLLRENGIPAFLQSDREVMASIPGKLALAWLRFINDKNDRRAVSVIMSYEGYSLSQITGTFSEVNEGRDILDVIPHYMAQEREFLYAKRKRPNDLLTSIFAFHRIADDDKYTDYAQAIIRIISSSFDGSLMTISDIIRLIEQDINNGTKYSLDTVLGRNAVIVQTMHKSKGLEYPIVLIGGAGTNPNSPEHSVLSYDPVFGIRCTMRYIRREIDGESVCGVCRSITSKAASKAKDTSYDEDRRELFVAMSRAKQYMWMAGMDKFLLKHLIGLYGAENGATDPKPDFISPPSGDMGDSVTDAPVIPAYAKRRRNIDVHSLMTYVGADSDDFEGGKEYGNAIHFIAERLAEYPRDDRHAALLAESIAGDRGLDMGKVCEDTVRINGFLAGISGLAHFSEMPCSLPVGDTTIRGVIDLLVDRGDHIEIYDYKTERDHRNIDEYRVQMSIYAHSVSASRKGARVVPYLFYVSKGDDPMEVDILPMSEIEARLERYMEDTGRAREEEFR